MTKEKIAEYADLMASEMARDLAELSDEAFFLAYGAFLQQIGMSPMSWASTKEQRKKAGRALKAYFREHAIPVEQVAHVLGRIVHEMPAAELWKLATQDLLVGMQLEHARSDDTRKARAKGTVLARRARDAKRTAEDDEPKAKACAMKRRGGSASSDRAIARRLKIGRARLKRILRPTS